ncbi:MAG: class I SAM-dependent methyltransferase [Bacillota bacterium]
MMTIDFGNVSNDYAKYRDHLPAVLFEQLIERGIDFKGQNVVDLGSGTGIFSRDLKKYGASVTGIEPSIELIQESIKLDKAGNIHDIKYIHARAEDCLLPGNYSIFTAVRAWHWFDRTTVIQNIKKFIEPHGHLIVINSIFKPDSEIARLTFEVLIDNQIEIVPPGSNADTKQRRNGFPGNWFNEWEDHSFQVMDEWQHNYNLDFTHEAWCGKIRSISLLANSDEDSRKKITDDLLAKLTKHSDILTIPHQFSVVILKHLITA